MRRAEGTLVRRRFRVHGERKRSRAVILVETAEENRRADDLEAAARRSAEYTRTKNFLRIVTASLDTAIPRSPSSGFKRRNVKCAGTRSRNLFIVSFGHVMW